MAPAALQEIGHRHRRRRRSSIVTSSTVGSNVDPRQMQDLPLNGRNFVDLTLLAPGSRQNASPRRARQLGTRLDFQLNVDGLRVTQNQTGGFGQPKYSQDAIAEFEFVSNRFDATQGGSMRHAGERHHQVRHQQPCRGRSRATSATTRFIAEGLRARTACCRTRISSSAGRSAGRS